MSVSLQCSNYLVLNAIFFLNFKQRKQTSMMSKINLKSGFPWTEEKLINHIWIILLHDQCDWSIFSSCEILNRFWTFFICGHKTLLQFYKTSSKKKSIIRLIRRFDISRIMISNETRHNRFLSCHAVFTLTIAFYHDCYWIKVNLPCAKNPRNCFVKIHLLCVCILMWVYYNALNIVVIHHIVIFQDAENGSKSTVSVSCRYFLEMRTRLIFDLRLLLSYVIYVKLFYYILIL